MNDLFTAVAKNDKIGLARLLAEGFDPDARDGDGRTALMRAVSADKSDLVDLLIKNGADIDAQDNNGFSALHFAAQDFRIAAATSLLRNHAKVDQHPSRAGRFGDGGKSASVPRVVRQPSERTVSLLR
jgi:ankyrin repeat protein